MRKSHLKGIFQLVLLVLLLASSPMVALAQQKDVAGSKDHPLISRYPGSVITAYMQKDFDEYLLALGPLKSGSFQKTQHLEGKVTRIIYHNPAGRSSLEIFRNYETALKQAGFQTLFACKQQECGESKNDEVLGWFGYLGQEYSRYLAAKLIRSGAEVYVALNVFESPQEPYRTTTLHIVEMKPMEAGLVTVDAAAMASDIAKTGHVAIYGIYFDFNKADVKSESEPAIKEIAKLLKQDPKLKLHVVGHTDSVGELKFNMDLSKRRAEAVVKVLTTKHGIAAARLRGDGVGPLAPVASNDTDEGRAKNRRVELVKQ
ncbi:MAG: DUF4892 domain-containing protein [Nitrospirae bacterium]|nr:DUF4892 domain-containing protein [Nitrospirota bacterium]